MQQSRIIMGMPITIKIVGLVSQNIFDRVFEYFESIDEKYSPFKENSEVSQINNGLTSVSHDMNIIMKLCKEANEITNGYFDVWRGGIFNPSGLVKGWAIKNAGNLVRNMGFENYFLDVGGDIEAFGKTWKIGIRNPFNLSETIKVLNIQDGAVATSGNYERGNHIYNPLGKMQNDIVSLTVIGSDILWADVMATAAFAMGREGISFIEKQKGLEGYMIDNKGMAIYTSGFNIYVG
ncbi:FAD:protein FMN transferase [Candidatus Amesbacteria bacterium]|nr:FAD:protein FMN transferase [Candidatus Amesbacteria bacterium]